MAYDVKVNDKATLPRIRLGETQDGQIVVPLSGPYEGQMLIGVNFDSVVAFRLGVPGLPVGTDDDLSDECEVLPPGTVITLTVK